MHCCQCVQRFCVLNYFYIHIGLALYGQNACCVCVLVCVSERESVYTDIDDLFI